MFGVSGAFEDLGEEEEDDEGEDDEGEEEENKLSMCKSLSYVFFP